MEPRSGGTHRSPRRRQGGPGRSAAVHRRNGRSPAGRGRTRPCQLYPARLRRHAAVGIAPRRSAGVRREPLRTTLPIGRVAGPTDIAALPLHLITTPAVPGPTYTLPRPHHPPPARPHNSTHHTLL